MTDTAERGPGRPPIGPQVGDRMPPEIIEALERARQSLPDGTRESRADTHRRLLAQALGLGDRPWVSGRSSGIRCFQFASHPVDAAGGLRMMARHLLFTTDPGSAHYTRLIEVVDQAEALIRDAVWLSEEDQHDRELLRRSNVLRRRAEQLALDAAVAAQTACPSCDQPRSRSLGNSVFESGSVCPHCGHVEP